MTQFSFENWAAELDEEGDLIIVDTKTNQKSKAIVKVLRRRGERSQSRF